MSNKIQIVYRNVDELIPYANNPRKNDPAVDAVANSIKEFGFKVPIVLDANDEIVTGHTRLKAAKKLGMTEVPTIVADDLDPNQVKAFRLADNKTGELAGWDFSLLDIELDGIDLDMSQFGFSDVTDTNFDDFFSDAEPKEGGSSAEEQEEIECPHCHMWFVPKK